MINDMFWLWITASSKIAESSPVTIEKWLNNGPTFGGRSLVCYTDGLKTNVGAGNDVYKVQSEIST